MNNIVETASPYIQKAQNVVGKENIRILLVVIALSMLYLLSYVFSFMMRIPVILGIGIIIGLVIRKYI